MSKFRLHLDKSDIGKRGCYILTTDIEQKESKTIQTFEGNEVTLYTPQKLNNNLRTALPTIGKIVVCLGDTEFNVGDEVICKHFTFLDINKESKHVHEDEKGTRYYKAYNEDVYFKITGDDLEPRNGVVLSEPILDKLINTTLDLTGDLVGCRRDIVKVLKTWTGCEVEKIRSEYRRKLANQKSKVRRREGNLEKGEEEREELLKKLKLQERENAKLNRELEKKDDIISEVKARKRKVIVKEKVHPLSKEAKRLERIASKPINEKHIDTFGVVAKTEKFRIENKLTANHLIVLLRADTETYVTVTDMKIMQKKAVAQLVERGLLAIQKVMRVNHYYPTVEGKELVKKYRDYISYGNNPILKNENT